jgi:hypothetical protein
MSRLRHAGGFAYRSPPIEKKMRRRNPGYRYQTLGAADPREVLSHCWLPLDSEQEETPPRAGDQWTTEHATWGLKHNSISQE